MIAAPISNDPALDVCCSKANVPFMKSPAAQLASLAVGEHDLGLDEDALPVGYRLAEALADIDHPPTYLSMMLNETLAKRVPRLGRLNHWSGADMSPA